MADTPPNKHYMETPHRPHLAGRWFCKGVFQLACQFGEGKALRCFSFDRQSQLHAPNRRSCVRDEAGNRASEVRTLFLHANHLCSLRRTQEKLSPAAKPIGCFILISQKPTSLLKMRSRNPMPLQSPAAELATKPRIGMKHSILFNTQHWVS